MPPATLPAPTLPVTVRLMRVPTLVKLEVTMVEARIVPVRFAALAVIATLDAAVN